MKRTSWQEIFDRVRAVDPLLVEAVQDVDRTLLRATMAMTPRQRLRAADRMRRDLQRFKPVSRNVRGS